MSSRKPTVSIVCLTYNQSDFIRKTLDSFLMQKTDFSFEVLIHDDASTDGTTSIIEEYAEKYPDIVKPVYEKTNRYSQNDYSFINDTYQRALGDYVAFCEGDDYWTDPDKLQLQVDYMENNPKTTVCFHLVKVFFENNKVENETYPQVNADSKFTIKELLKKNYIQSNSVLYKKSHTDYTTLPSNIIPSDWYMHLYHAQHGEIGFINKVMSAYRKHSGGIWWDSRLVWKKYGVGHLNLYKALLDIYGDNIEYRAIINNNIRHAIKKISDVSDSDEDAENTIIKYPELIREAFILDKSLSSLYSQAGMGQFDQRVIQEKNRIINNLTQQLNQLRKSNSYKAGRALMVLPQQVKRGTQLIIKQYLPDGSGLVHDKRSEELDGLLKRFYQYKPKVSGLKVAVVSRGVSSSPTSSFFIRLISPLTWGWNGKRVNLSMFDGNVTVLSPGVDICIVQRTAFNSIDTAQLFVKNARDNGIKLIADTDDAFTKLDPSHPQYEAQKDHIEASEYVFNSADKVWVSTDYIAKNYKNATVLPNSLDPRVWHDKKNHLILRSNIIKMLYMGTMTHEGDLALVLSAIEKINKKHKDAISLTIIGVTSDVPQKDWITVLQPPKERRVYPEFVTWLLEQKQQFDIGIAPLVDSEFNKAKSDIKVLDYLAMGVLPVVSDLLPYKNTELDPFIVRVGYGKDDWDTVLEDIVSNRRKYATLKKQASDAAHTYVTEGRSISRTARMMLKDLRKINKLPNKGTASKEDN